MILYNFYILSNSSLLLSNCIIFVSMFIAMTTGYALTFIFFTLVLFSPHSTEMVFDLLGETYTVFVY